MLEHFYYAHVHTWLKPLYVGKVLATAVGSWLGQQWQFCLRMSTVVDVGPTCHVLGVVKFVKTTESKTEMQPDLTKPTDGQNF